MKAKKKCKQCGKRIPPYSPPTQDVPPQDDPFCSRTCCEDWHGVQRRKGRKL